MNKTFDSLVTLAKQKGISQVCDSPDAELYNLFFNTDEYNAEYELDDDFIHTLELRGGSIFLKN